MIRLSKKIPSVRLEGRGFPPAPSTASRKDVFSSRIIWGLLVANLLALVALYTPYYSESALASLQQDLPVPSGFSGSISSTSIDPSQPQPPPQQQHRSLLQEQTLSTSSLLGIRLLVAIAAYDFSQLPHLEEVLDSYHDVCVAGVTVKVVLHTTVAFPVTLLDLLQTRFPCPGFSLDIRLLLPRVKLHLVDYHRKLFYNHIDQYDLFIYTEDDIRITPRIVQTYLEQTERVKKLVEGTKYIPSDFNVGVVRFEYNFPSNVIMDDTTR
jgi:hypothetical protein